MLQSAGILTSMQTQRNGDDVRCPVFPSSDLFALCFAACSTPEKGFVMDRQKILQLAEDLLCSSDPYVRHTHAFLDLKQHLYLYWRLQTFWVREDEYGNFQGENKGDIGAYYLKGITRDIFDTALGTFHCFVCEWERCNLLLNVTSINLQKEKLMNIVPLGLMHICRMKLIAAWHYLTLS
jgi:hypothetical protein